MKIVYPIFLVLLCVSCGDKGNQHSNDSMVEINDSTNIARKNQDETPTNPWIQSFNDFRDAIYHDDREKVKSYFKFPIIDSSYEIRYLIGEPIKVTILDVAFTEKEFDKHYSRIISSNFINSILKIKSKELFRTNYFTTPEWLDSSKVRCQMMASIDTVEHLLQLNLNYNTPAYYQDEKGNKEMENDEFSIIYTFSLVPEGRIMFKQIQLAG